MPRRQERSAHPLDQYLSQAEKQIITFVTFPIILLSWADFFLQKLFLTSEHLTTLKVKDLFPVWLSH